MSNEIYYVQVEEDKKWETKTSITANCFFKETDISFIVDDEQKEILSNYQNQPIRLCQLIFDEKTDTISGYEIKLFKSWKFFKDQVLVLKKNANYVEFFEEKTDLEASH